MKIYAQLSLQASEKQLLIFIIEHFGLGYDEQFNLHTTVIVSDKVMNVKYKIAKMKKIPMVTQKWLLDSKQNDQLLDLKEY